MSPTDTRRPEATHRPPTRVAVIGASGRLGSLACAQFDLSPAVDLVAAYTSSDDWAARVGGQDGAEVALEVTVAGQGARHGETLLRAGVRPVIGTSGVTPAELEALDTLARERGLGGLVVPNFSLGIWALQRAVREASRLLEQVEILELHHNGKKDAPSGTALETARQIESLRSEATAQRLGPVPIHSVRLPGLYAHQEVLLGSVGETLTIRHDMQGPQAFALGLLGAVAHARTAEGIGLGLDAVFGPKLAAH